MYISIDKFVINGRNLKDILEDHKLWLSEPFGQETHKKADLRNADLRNANLNGADLNGADLNGADLSGADLRNADLRNANLRNANLNGADLNGAESNENTAFFALQCPESGAFTAYKTCQGKIVELEILADAKRSSGTSRKCRCSAAKVISITNPDGSDSGLTEIESNHDSSFLYHIGEIVSVDNFDENRWNECSSGIHFFITRQEAVNYHS